MIKLSDVLTVYEQHNINCHIVWKKMPTGCLTEAIERKRMKDYFEKVAGILQTKGKLTKSILKERAKEKKIEEEKINTFISRKSRPTK